MKKFKSLRHVPSIVGFFALPLCVSLLDEGQAAAACAAPSPTQIVVYGDSNLGGPCWTLNQGLYPGPTFFPNDAISSVVVGSAVNAQMFRDSNYGGDVAFYAPGTYATTGRDTNDSFSSIKILPRNGISVAAKFLGNTNNNGGLGSNIQGLANTGGFSYVTNTTRLSKYPLSATLGSPVLQRSLSDYTPLTNIGCNHFGDPDVVFMNSTSYLLIPLEGCNFQNIPGYSDAERTALAVFNPVTLQLIGFDSLFLNPVDAAFVAVQGNQFLYSSNGKVDASNPIKKYSIDANALAANTLPSPHYILNAQPDLFLTHEDGTPVSMGNMQGGVFSSDGRVFYTTNGLSPGLFGSGCDAAMEGNDWGGIRAFNAATGTRIAASSLTYGFFQYEWHCGFPQFQEAEGIDWVNLGGSGILHSFVYDNSTGTTYFKHYNF